MTIRRHIIFDTETTGLSAETDRITEIGAIETIDYLPTGRFFHCYCKPNKEIANVVTKITGLTNEFLEDKKEIDYHIPGFLEFICDSPLVAHNSQFDKKMINAELARYGYDELEDKRFVDTLEMSRKAFPGKKHTLDALCARLGVKNDDREVHTALVDSIILMEAFRKMSINTQEELDLISRSNIKYYNARQRLNPIRVELNEQDHKKYCEENNFSVWKRAYRRAR